MILEDNDVCSDERNRNMTNSKSVEERILQSLQDPNWDYRTVDGIAKETGEAASNIEAFLEAHPESVWKSRIPDRQGRSLYTVKGRRAQSKEFWRALSTYIRKQTL